MNHNRVHVSMLLDRSGSMESIKEETIRGVNSFVDEHKKLSQDVSLTMAQFDDAFEYLERQRPIRDVPALDAHRYLPRNTTALRDAFARLIDETGADLAAIPEPERPERVLFVVMTDGLENASQHVTQEQLRAKVEHQRTAYQWQFLYLGANQDATLTAQQYGIPQAAAINFSATPSGTRGVMRSTSKAAVAYSAGMTSSANFGGQTLAPEETLTEDNA
jgi:hypothetical protein